MSYDAFFKQAKKSAGQKNSQQFVHSSMSDERIEAELRKAFGMKAPVKPVIKSSSKKSQAQRRKQKFPLYPAIVGLAMVCGAVSYLAFPQFFERQFAKVEIDWMGQAAASADGKKAPATKAESKEKVAAASESRAGESVASASVPVTEDPSYFSKLKERKEQLDSRESELNQLEEELHRQKAEIEQRIVELTQIRQDIAKTLEDRVQADEVKVKKLVDLYSNMKPKQAAEVISTIDVDLAVEVLANMKKKNAADVMNVLDSKKAKELSERLTGYRRGTASER